MEFHSDPLAALKSIKSRLTISASQKNASTQAQCAPVSSYAELIQPLDQFQALLESKSTDMSRFMDKAANIKEITQSTTANRDLEALFTQRQEATDALYRKAVQKTELLACDAVNAQFRQVDQLSCQVEQLENQLYLLQNDTEETQQNVADHAEFAAELLASNQYLNQQCQYLNDLLQQQSEQHGAQLNAVQHKQEEIQREHEAKVSETEAYAAELTTAKFEKLIELLNGEIATLKQKLEQQEPKQQQCEEIAVQTSKDIQQDERIQQLATNNETLMKQMKYVQDREVEASASAQQLKKENIELQAKILEVELDLQLQTTMGCDLIAREEKFLEQLKAEEAKNASNIQKLNAEMYKVKELETMISELQAKSLQTEQLLRDSSAECEILRQNLQQSEKMRNIELQQCRNEHNLEISKLNDEMTTYKEQLTSQQKFIDENKLQIDKAKLEAQRLLYENNQLQQQVIELQNRDQKIEKDSEIKAQLNELASQVKSLQSSQDIDTLKQTVKIQAEKLVELQKQKLENFEKSGSNQHDPISPELLQAQSSIRDDYSIFERKIVAVTEENLLLQKENTYLRTLLSQNKDKKAVITQPDHYVEKMRHNLLQSQTRVNELLSRNQQLEIELECAQKKINAEKQRKLEQRTKIK